MLIFYENALGTLQFCGGDGLWNITDYSGFCLAEKSFQTLSYAENDGQITLRERVEPRLITLKGDCRVSRAEFSRGMRILNQRGCLSVVVGNSRRRISAYCCHFELQKKHGDWRTFIFQLMADDPYFLGEKELQLPLYSREDLVSGNFTLPCLFTKRIMTSVVMNQGDVTAEPIFTLICKSAGAESEEKGILIENKTTGKSFRFLYSMQTGEEIKVDIPGRRITSNIKTDANNQGNLIYCMSSDTVLKNMYLAPGENQFEVKNFNPKSDILVVCAFDEKYLEAVI